MPDSETVDALEEIYPRSITVELASEAVKMQPLGIKHLYEIGRAIHLVAEIFNGGELALAYIQEHSADLIPVVAASSGKDEAAIAAMPGGDCLKLFGGAFRANRGFFFEYADLRYGLLGADLMKTFTGTGAAPSTTSKTADTPSASPIPQHASSDS